MDSENYKEGHYMQRSPLLKRYWKNHFETYVKSNDIDLWHIIVYGNHKTTRNKDVLEKDSEISKVRKEKYKSLALKERKISSDEEISCSKSDDEEYAMAVRDFKKFFRRRGKFVRQPHDDKKNFQKIKKYKKEKEDHRHFKCGDPNHFISYCPKHSYNQKAFVVGCWSDSEDDSKKEEICLMATDNNDVRLKFKLEPDEWIKYSGCSRHMTGNKDLFSSYKAIDRGNAMFESNTKSKIVRKDTITHNSHTIMMLAM
uniref:Zf-CCHC domain-containing protein/UBN2 domain-containing protein n=1 Tax=Tanacetum cinerariifolium TaxID=118510 RepID=A0A699IGQ7_TANCI|nr:zf-CCHC domain-containing protein/UBN2 domain-containing protein [Tanacetum cinerariifolium]